MRFVLKVFFVVWVVGVFVHAQAYSELAPGGAWWPKILLAAFWPITFFRYL